MHDRRQCAAEAWHTPTQPCVTDFFKAHEPPYVARTEDSAPRQVLLGSAHPRNYSTDVKIQVLYKCFLGSAPAVAHAMVDTSSCLNPSPM